MKKWFFFASIFVLSCQPKSEPQQQATLDAPKQTINLKNIYPSRFAAFDLSPAGIAKHDQKVMLLAQAHKIMKPYKLSKDAIKALSPEQLEAYKDSEGGLFKADYWSTDFGGCSWYCGCTLDSIWATSTLSPTSTDIHKANNIHDFSLKTAWVEGKIGAGESEFITFQFPKQESSITSVKIYNGYMKSAKTWKENGRVKTLKLFVNDAPIALLHLKDSCGAQTFDIDACKDPKLLLLKFQIVDTFKGDKHDDTAISELEFDGIGDHH
jgi:hypothetical protein